MPQLSRDNQTKILKIFLVTLSKESHILFNDPHLLWQQLYNRLQWEGEVVQRVLHAELKQRSMPREKPWIKLKTKHSESKWLSQRLNVGEDIKECVYSPDGSLIICDCKSGFRVWDTDTGTEVTEPTGLKSLVQNIISFNANWSNSRVNVDAPRFDNHRSLTNPNGITCVNNTPKFFMDFMEGFLKISYPGPTKLSFNFWKLKSGRVRSTNIWTLKYIDFGIEDCAFSPDQKHAITCLSGRKKTIIFWDIIKGKKLANIKNQDYRITACDFSPDGKQIVTAGFDYKEKIWIIRIWDIKSRKCNNTFRGHSGDALDEIKWCHFSPDGLKVISGGNDQTVYIWETTRNLMEPVTRYHKGEVSGCKFGFDGSQYVSSGGKSLSIHSSNNGEILSFWEKGKFLDPNLNPKGNLISAILVVDKFMNPYESDYYLQIRETKNGDSILKKEGSEKIPISHTSFGKPETPTRHLMYKSGGFLENGQSVLTAGYGNYATNLVLWDVESGKPLKTLDGYCETVENIRISKGERYLGVTTYNAKTIDIWNLSTGKKIMSFKGHESTVYDFGFSPDNKKIVSSSSDGRLIIWELSNGNEMNSFLGHSSDIKFCGFLPSADQIVSAGSDKSLRWWDISGGLITFLPLTHAIVKGDIHPLLPIAILGDAAGSVHLVEFICG